MRLTITTSSTSIPIDRAIHSAIGLVRGSRLSSAWLNGATLTVVTVGPEFMSVDEAIAALERLPAATPEVGLALEEASIETRDDERRE